MIEINSFLKKIQLKLDARHCLPHQASALAYDLFLLAYKFEQKDTPEVCKLIALFSSSLRNWELDDLVARQINYAIRLAKSKSDLEYEEMHKLFSLCDQVYAFEYLGFQVDQLHIEVFRSEVLSRFIREKVKAKMVAEDKMEEWQKEFWWYCHESWGQK